MFHSLTKLKTLILEFCDIEKIEKGAFNGLHNLKLLNLRANKLSDCENFSAFTDVNNLSCLLLDYNLSLTSRFSKMKSIDKLSITNDYNLVMFDEIEYLNTKCKTVFDFKSFKKFYRNLKQIENIDQVVNGNEKFFKN